MLGLKALQELSLLAVFSLFRDSLKVDLYFQELSEDQRQEMGLELGTPTTDGSHDTYNSCSKLVGLICRGMSEKHFAETPLPLNISTKKFKACQH